MTIPEFKIPTSSATQRRRLLDWVVARAVELGYSDVSISTEVRLNMMVLVIEIRATLLGVVHIFQTELTDDHYRTEVARNGWNDYQYRGFDQLLQLMGKRAIDVANSGLATAADPSFIFVTKAAF
jgi:hypothetical protein